MAVPCPRCGREYDVALFVLFGGALPLVPASFEQAAPAARSVGWRLRSALRKRLTRAQVVAFIRQQLETHRSDLRVKDLDLAALISVSAARRAW